MFSRVFGRPTLLAVWVVTSAISLYLWVPFLLSHYRDILFGSFSDFSIYHSDALRAWQSGWSAYYASGPNAAGVANVNPPLQGLLLLPFLPLPYPVAFLLFTAISILSLALVWRLLLNRYWFFFPLALCMWPVLDTLRLGQVTLLIAAIVTLSWWLSNRGSAWSAGLVLSLATLKPQLIFLLPFALLLGGRRREFWGFTIGSVGIAAISFALVGISGLTLLLSNLQGSLNSASAFHLTDTMILRLWLPGTLGLALALSAILLTLILAYRARQQSPAAIFAIGLLGSLLATPFLHQQDLVLWIPTALLLRRSIGLPIWLAVTGLIVVAWPFFGVPLVSATALALFLFRKPSLSAPEPVLVGDAPVAYWRLDDQPSALDHLA